MKLSEIAQQLPNQETTKFLTQFKIKNYSIRPDGIIDVEGDVDLAKFKGTSFPVQFGFVSGGFYCHNTPITSLQGAPSSVGGDFYCHNTPITSLQGAPSSVGGGFYCYHTLITSLHGINKIIGQIDGDFACCVTVSHMLGLLLIKGIKRFDIDVGINKIMNKYIGRPDMIIEAQDELIEAGFKEQAKL